MAQDPPRPDDEDDVGQGPGSLRGVPRATVPPGRHDGSRAGQLLLRRPVVLRDGEGAGVDGHRRRVRDRPGSDVEPFARRRLDHPRRGPPHPEVGLDRAGVPEGADDLAVDARVLPLRRDDGVDVGRRAPDVDDEQVATGDLGEHLDAPEHRVGGGRADELGEAATSREALAADDVGEEGLADGAARRLGRDDPDARQDVVGDDEPAPGGLEERGHLRASVDVPGDDDRGAEPRLRQSRRVVEQHVGVAAVGATDEEDEVGSGRPQGRDVGAAHRAGRDVDDLRARRQPHPVPCLGGHRPLVADDGEPQPSSGAGADEDLVGLTPAVAVPRPRAPLRARHRHRP